MGRRSITDTAAEEAEADSTEAETETSTSSSSSRSKADDEIVTFTTRLPKSLVETFDDYVDDHKLLRSRNQGVEYAVEELLERENRL